MNKRIIIAALALALALSALAGCDTKKNYIGGQEPTSSPSVSTQEPTSSPDVETGAAAQTEDDTDASLSGTPTKEPAAKPQESIAPNVAPTPAATPAPTATPTPAPSISANDLMSKMINSLPADSHNLSEMPYDLYEAIYGINPANFEEVLVYGSMMNVKSNEIIIIKAKNSAGVAEAKSLLNNRHAALDTQWEHYLPDQYELVQAGSVNTSGLYVSLVIADGAQSAVNTFNSLTK